MVFRFSLLSLLVRSVITNEMGIVSCNSLYRGMINAYEVLETCYSNHYVGLYQPLVDYVLEPRKLFFSSVLAF